MKRGVKHHDNPWGLTAREAEVMTTMLQQGCHKLTARALDVSLSTIEAHVHAASQKMPHRLPLLRYLAWDRWLRERDQAQAISSAKAARPL